MERDCETMMDRNLTLTIVGSEEEIRGYLDGANYRSTVLELREAILQRFKHGHGFNTPEEALGWVEDMLAEEE